MECAYIHDDVYFLFFNIIQIRGSKGQKDKNRSLARLWENLKWRSRRQYAQWFAALTGRDNCFHAKCHGGHCSTLPAPLTSL